MIHKNPVEYEQGLKQYIFQQNAFRILVFAIFTFFLSFLLYFMDYRFYQGGICADNPLYCQLLIGMHTFLLVFSSIYVLLYYTYIKRVLETPINSKKNILQYLYMAGYLLFMAGMSVVGQLYHGTITLYLVGAMALAAIMMIPRRISFFLYLGVHVAFLAGMFAFQKESKLLVSNSINGTVGVAIAYLINMVMYKYKSLDFVNNKIIVDSNNKLQLAKKRIESLLNNVLPEKIVHELNEKGASEPVINANATIVFTDFVSFSKFAETSDSKVLIDHLDIVFKKFDDIVKYHGLEKLKTIGDSYMFSGGLFSSSNQIEECLEASLEMIDYIEQNSNDLIEKTGYNWAMRIGLHTGSVVTGVIGKWRFLYDTWGNTVNVASRLEAASEPNQINISKIVYEQVKDKYSFTNRGTIPVKNMDPVEMYFIQRTSAQKAKQEQKPE